MDSAEQTLEEYDGSEGDWTLLKPGFQKRLEGRIKLVRCVGVIWCTVVACVFVLVESEKCRAINAQW